MSRGDRASFGIPFALGGVVGGVAGMFAYALAWVWGHPDAGFLEGWAASKVAVGAREPLGLVLFLVGATLGGLTAASFAGGRPVMAALTSLGSGLLVGVSSAIGAGFGALAYLVLWLRDRPGAGLGEALAVMPTAIHAPQEPLFAMVVAGGLIGGGVALMAARELGQRMVRAAAGATVGALGGLIMYSLTYVLMVYRELPSNPNELLRFGEAVHSFTPVEFVFVGLGGAFGAVTARYSWRFYGIVTLVSLVSVVLGYVGYTLAQTLPAVPPEWQLLAWVLFISEAGTLILVVLYSFYTIDVTTRKKWNRAASGAPFSKFYVPRVALHVPMFNEPPEVVIASLRTLLALDYPKSRYLIMVIDDSTNQEMSAPVERFCDANEIHYIKRPDRRGYKAGALNDALAQTPEDVDLITIIDADYQVAPEYLRETVGYFADPDLGWVQTPQEYRNRHQSFLSEQYYLADQYFYKTVLPSRNEENTIIFCGTMGLIRRESLIDAGRWGEPFLCEDAELSVRLLGRGWNALYADRAVYGRGLIPATYDGYKKQLFRWAFGGGQLLRRRLPYILFGPYSRRQAFDYFVGSIHWIEGLFILTIAMTLLGVGFADLFGKAVITHHGQEVLLIGLVPLFLLVDGLSRLHMAMRRNIRMSMRSTIRVLGMWYSVKFSNARGALKGLLGIRMAFLRTPKGPNHRVGRWEAFRRAMRLTPFESLVTLAILGVTAAIGVKTMLWGLAPGERPEAKLFLQVWLLYYALIFGSAPYYAYKSFTTFVPDAALPAAVRPLPGTTAEPLLAAAPSPVPAAVDLRPVTATVVAELAPPPGSRFDAAQPGQRL